MGEWNGKAVFFVDKPLLRSVAEPLLTLKGTEALSGDTFFIVPPDKEGGPVGWEVWSPLEGGWGVYLNLNHNLILSNQCNSGNGNQYFMRKSYSIFTMR